MAEGDVGEEVDYFVPEVGGLIYDEDDSDQNKDGARRDCRNYAFLSLVHAGLRVLRFV